MKMLNMFIAILSGFLSFSTNATTMVATGSNEHTINFNFGRTSSNVFLCKVSLGSTGGVDRHQGLQDSMSFFKGVNQLGTIVGFETLNQITFTEGNSPTGSVLHLASNVYGLRTEFEFCHHTEIAGTDPNNTGGTIETEYQIVTPADLNYFASAGVLVSVVNNCLGQVDTIAPFLLASNISSGFTPVSSIPFAPALDIATFPNMCTTKVIVEETSTSTRPANGGASNVGVNVQEFIYYGL